MHVQIPYPRRCAGADEQVIFNFHIHLFTHTHATLPNASTSSQSHAPPGSHASTSSHTSSHWLRAWLSTDHSQQAVSSAPLGPCDPQTSSQARHHHPPPPHGVSHEPEPHMQPSRREMALAVKPPRWVTRATAQARHGQLTRCGLRWYDLMRYHRNCCSAQPPLLLPGPALQPQPPATASHAAD